MKLKEVKKYESTAKDFTKLTTVLGHTLTRDESGLISIDKFESGDTVKLNGPVFYQSEKTDRTCLSIGGWFVNLQGLNLPELKSVNTCRCSIVEGKDRLFLNIEPDTFDFEIKED